MTPLMAHMGVGKIHHQLVVSDFRIRILPVFLEYP